jgi:hypothetical protein
MDLRLLLAKDSSKNQSDLVSRRLAFKVVLFFSGSGRSRSKREGKASHAKAGRTLNYFQWKSRDQLEISKLFNQQGDSHRCLNDKRQET